MIVVKKLSLFTLPNITGRIFKVLKNCKITHFSSLTILIRGTEFPTKLPVRRAKTQITG